MTDTRCGFGVELPRVSFDDAIARVRGLRRVITALADTA
jgi:hypothetical protein